MSPQEIEENIKQKYLDATLLYENGRYANSIYLCGYCVELALKYAITKKLNWIQFRTDNKFKFLKVHDLDLLLAFTGEELRIKKLAHWSVVQAWSENKRYENPSYAKQNDSEAMLEATKKLVEELCTILL